MGNGKQFFTRLAFLLVLVVGFLMPLSVHADNVYLPLTIKCGGCASLLGDWSIQATGLTHSAAFFQNGIFRMIFQGETQPFFGNYSCENGQFEGLIVTTENLKINGALACSGTSMSGTFEVRKNDIVINSGNFTGQKF